MAAKRILLVEDENDVCNMLTLALRGEGYEVERADTATRARQRLKGISYDLVITDWRLPDGDGLEIADAAADDGIKTILISGYLFQIPAERTTRHELLMKPMRPHELAEAVERIIGKANE